LSAWVWIEAAIALILLFNATLCAMALVDLTHDER